VDRRDPQTDEDARARFVFHEIEPNGKQEREKAGDEERKPDSERQGYLGHRNFLIVDGFPQATGRVDPKGVGAE